MPNSLFQSTLPARGATKWKYVYTYSEKISIHAPRTGSDYQPILLIPQMLPFQSTLPARGATNTYGAISYYVIFQSTLPARGATMPLSIISRQDLQISIHAPRTGSDISYAVPIIPSDYFNPRSPHGERHYLPAEYRELVNFNPRSPHGERLERMSWKQREGYFNPRSPHGERRHGERRSMQARIFQSTLPARGATPRR